VAEKLSERIRHLFRGAGENLIDLGNAAEALEAERDRLNLQCELLKKEANSSLKANMKAEATVKTLTTLNAELVKACGDWEELHRKDLRDFAELGARLAKAQELVVKWKEEEDKTADWLLKRNYTELEEALK
jgi:hypothetical protein